MTAPRPTITCPDGNGSHSFTVPVVRHSEKRPVSATQAASSSTSSCGLLCVALARGHYVHGATLLTERICTPKHPRRTTDPATP